jgi:predicted RecA/RadA family phage recombinase
MADIGTFPTIRNVLAEGDNIGIFTATTAVTAGMVVAFAAAGVSGAVIPAVKGVTIGNPIGVAITNIAAGAKGPVAMNGCIVYVANAESNVDIDAGDVLEPNDNAVGGTVSAAGLVDAGVVLVYKYKVGIAIDDILRSETGRMLIGCGSITSANNA